MGRILVCLHPHETNHLMEHHGRLDYRQSTRILRLVRSWSQYLHDLTVCFIRVHDGLAAPTLLRDKMDILQRLQQGRVQDVEIKTDRSCSCGVPDSSNSRVCQLCHQVLPRSSLFVAEYPTVDGTVLVGHQICFSICR